MATVDNITQDINDLIYEHISNEYAWGNLGGIKVMIMKANGYINAPKMATEAHEYEKSKLNDKQDITKKKFNDWSRLRSVQRTITVFSGVTGIPVGGMMVEVGQHDKLDISGTYIHPDLAIKFADWLSDYFGYYTSQIVRNHLAKEERERHAAEKRALENKNTELKEENMTLTQKLEAFRLEMSKRHDEYMRKVDNTLNELVDVKVELKEANNKLDEAHDQNYILENKVDEALEETIIVRQKVQELLPPLITPKTKDITGTEMCIILKRNNPNAYYKYYIICAYLNTALKKAKKLEDDNDMIEIFRTNSPNSKNLLKRIKEDEFLIGSKIDRRRRNVVPREVKKIETHMNDIKLIDDVITEDEFIDAIRRLDDVKEEIVLDI